MSSTFEQRLDSGIQASEQQQLQQHHSRRHHHHQQQQRQKQRPKQRHQQQHASSTSHAKRSGRTASRPTTPLQSDPASAHVATAAEEATTDEAKMRDADAAARAATPPPDGSRTQHRPRPAPAWRPLDAEASLAPYLEKPRRLSTADSPVVRTDRYINASSGHDARTAFVLAAPLYGTPSRSKRKQPGDPDNTTTNNPAAAAATNGNAANGNAGNANGGSAATMPASHGHGQSHQNGTLEVYHAVMLNEAIESRSARGSSSSHSVPGQTRVFSFETTTTPSKRARITPADMIVANSVSSFKPSSLDMLKSPVRKVRHIAKTPYKVLDAPELQDDFYLNLVDWSAGNQLSVGLGSCVYLWHAKSHAVTKLCDLGQNDHVTSVSWIQRASHLAVGTNKGLVQIWDVERSKLVRQFTGHQGRVGALAWNANVLTSSSRDRSIFNRDTREPRDHVTKLVGHRQEVCGLKWSPSGDILASGGNDNRLFLWDKRQWSSLASFDQHVAAVKAISWSPHEHGLLASGGGTADRCIRFWNTQTLTPISHVDTGSQVCNLAWSKNSNEIVSTHGYSLNQIIVWKYPRMEPVATLTGHTFRVLYLAMSPDGQNIVTGAGDETLRFWNVFAKPKQRGSGTPTGMTVR